MKRRRRCHSAASAASITEGGRPVNARTGGVTFIRHENSKAVYRLESGVYEFISRLE